MHSYFSVHRKQPTTADPSPVVRTRTAKPRIVRFTNARLLRDHDLILDDLWVRDGIIADPKSLFWEGALPDETVDCGGRILAPGLIDVQINGGWGVDFSTGGPELAAGLRLVSRRLLAHGITSFLPTVITSSLESYRAVLPQIVPTAGSPEGAAVLGVHLEGPFISPSKPGCHPPAHIIANKGSDDKAVVGRPDALRRACGEHLAHVRLVTLAPELPGSEMLVAELLARGVVVSAGHSNASSAQMEASLKWGVTMCTHLFNAMPPFHPREPGIVGLLGSKFQPRPFLGLISDGVHVHPASVKLAAAARPDSIVLVSDGIVAMGLPEGQHHFGEVPVEIVSGDKAYRSGTTTLAGAVVALDECVRRFRKYTNCSTVRALEAASLRPAEALGMQSSKGGLHVGADADLILLDDELNVQATYVGGVRAWSAQEDGMLEEEDMVTSPPRESSNTSEPPPHTLGSGSRPPPARGSKRKK